MMLRNYKNKKVKVNYILLVSVSVLIFTSTLVNRNVRSISEVTETITIYM